MNGYIKNTLFCLCMLSSLHSNAQYVIYIGTDKRADNAQTEATAVLSVNLKQVMAMQKKMHEAETYLNFELKEQESFLLDRYPSEQQIDAYIKNSPLVVKIFNERFASQEAKLNSLRHYLIGWEYASLFDRSIKNIQEDMNDIQAQWKQATGVKGNTNRMSNAQRNSLMEETFERFKQLCVTTQQLKAAMVALNASSKNK